MISKPIAVILENFFFAQSWELLNVSHCRTELKTKDFRQIIGTVDFVFFGREDRHRFSFFFFFGDFFFFDNERLRIVFLLFLNLFFNFFFYFLFLDLLFNFLFNFLFGFLMTFFKIFIVFLNLLHENLSRIFKLILAFLESLLRFLRHFLWVQDLS